MQRKAAVFCHNGLGDGIISLVLSNNFHQNGWEIDTFHNNMDSLQNWVPHLPILKYPDETEISKILQTYDEIIIFHNDSSNFVLRLIQEGKAVCAEKVKVIYAYPSKNIVFEPYYKDSYIDPRIPIVKNLEKFCQRILNFPHITKHNGFLPPRGLIHKKYAKRVALHTVSSRDGKNWPREKYVKLALHLKNEGFEPSFILGGPKDRGDWDDYLKDTPFACPMFSNLDEIAQYIYESGFFVGNDSGLGHLASCLSVPTVTISRRKTVARFWRPSWTEGAIVNPSSLIPNIRGLRIRDRKWKSFVSVKKVLRAFEKLYQTVS
jgi:ADP-heptose:LPS heptosyltransferase